MAASTDNPLLRLSADGLGSLRQDAGLNVLHLEGTPEQMARQHGELLAAETREGTLPFMARLLGEQIKAAGVGPLSRLSAALARKAIETACLMLARNLPAEQRRAIHALAEAAGLPSRVADQAIGTPDMAMVIMGLVDRFWRLPPALRSGGGFGLLPTLRHPASWGCSGAVALPASTRDGHLLHGRNMDYDGVGHWDRHPVVAFCRPTGGGLPYAYISSAGVHTAALTGLNVAGIFLGSNTSPTTDCSLRGQPFFGLNDQVVQRARSLDEAIALLATRHAASGYNVHVSHGPSAQAALIEYSYSAQQVRTPHHDLLTATNHYCTPQMAKTTPRVLLVDSANTHGRLARLNARLEAARGDITLPTILDCLRDGVEHGSGRANPLGDVICNWLNLSAVVADVTAGRFWATCDPAPAVLGRLVGFDLQAELDHFREPRRYPNDILPPAHEPGAPRLEGLRAYARAHDALGRLDDPRQALDEVDAALAQLPDEPRAILTKALIALKLDRRDDASALAERYLSLRPEGDPRRYRAHLIRAWCEDLSGRHREAAPHYRRAAAENPGQDESELELDTWRRRPFTQHDRQRLHVDLFNAKRMLV